MTSDLTIGSDFSGPHNDRELELMLAGAKPLSMFTEYVESDFKFFPEEEFDALVAEGRLIKNVTFDVINHPKDGDLHFRRVLYALPGEEWRIKAMLLVLDLYRTLAPGWRPDLDRVIGLLLGYEREHVDKFLTAQGLEGWSLAPVRDRVPR